jgi:hypothetical protein
MATAEAQEKLTQHGLSADQAASLAKTVTGGV